MSVSKIKEKLQVAGYSIITERKTPDSKSILLVVNTKDKIIIEEGGLFSVIGANKEAIEKVLNKPDSAEVLVRDVAIFLGKIKKVINYMVSAITGGIISNRADALIQNLDIGEEKENYKTGKGKQVLAIYKSYFLVGNDLGYIKSIDKEYKKIEIFSHLDPMENGKIYDIDLFLCEDIVNLKPYDVVAVRDWRNTKYYDGIYKGRLEIKKVKELTYNDVIEYYHNMRG